MKKNDKNVIKPFLKQVRAELKCTCNMKDAFISDLKSRISEIEYEGATLTIEDIYNVIGTPEEIARGFESRENLDKIKVKARKYTRTKIICAVLLVLTLIAVTVTIAVIKQNDNYVTDTCINTYIEVNRKS